MKLFNVYPIENIELCKGNGMYVIDTKGNKYLDLYGGHAVISIGHNNSHYIQSIQKQLNNISYYSNSILISQQRQLSCILGKISGYKDYSLFLCNSGTEANENALKIASLYNGKNKIVFFKGAFHGRTSGSASITDNYKITSSFDAQHNTIIMEYENIKYLENILKSRDICAVITEGIQGISGIFDPGKNFFLQVSKLCKKYNVLFIVDEIQSGYGRTGNFFAHQLYKVCPDIITIAKGMGNGFPIGGVLIHPKIHHYYGMLGSTFGGNYLACVAAISVLEVIKYKNLIDHAKKIGNFFRKKISEMVPSINEIRGRGLMLGLKFNFHVEKLRKILLHKEKIFVGISNNPYILRLLPPLIIKHKHIEYFLDKLNNVLEYLDK